MKQKNFTVCGMPYEEYLKRKHEMLARAVMRANGWKDDEYEIK